MQKDNNKNKKNVQIQYIDNRWPDKKPKRNEKKKDEKKRKRIGYSKSIYTVHKD